MDKTDELPDELELEEDGETQSLEGATEASFDTAMGAMGELPDELELVEDDDTQSLEGATEASFDTAMGAMGELPDELELVEDDDTQSLEGATEASFDTAMDAMGELLGELSEKVEDSETLTFEGTTETSFDTSMDKMDELLGELPEKVEDSETLTFEGTTETSFDASLDEMGELPDDLELEEDGETQNLEGATEASFDTAMDEMGELPNELELAEDDETIGLEGSTETSLDTSLDEMGKLPDELELVEDGETQSLEGATETSFDAAMDEIDELPDDLELEEDVETQSLEGAAETSFDAAMDEIDELPDDLELEEGGEAIGLEGSTETSFDTAMDAMGELPDDLELEEGGETIGLDGSTETSFDTSLDEMGELPNELELEEDDETIGLEGSTETSFDTSLDEMGEPPNELELEEGGETQSFEGATEASFDAAMDEMGELLGELSEKVEDDETIGLKGTTEASLNTATDVMGELFGEHPEKGVGGETIALKGTTEVSLDATTDVMGELFGEHSEKVEDGETIALLGTAEASFDAATDAMDELPDELSEIDLPATDTPRRSWGVRIAIATLVVVALAAGIGSFYIRVLNHYEGAIQQWTTVGPLLEQRKFKEANQQLETILTRLDKVRFVRQDEKMHLLNEINKVRSTERFHHGLLGNVLFIGHYYSKQELENFHDIKNRLAKAEAFGSAGRWQDAVEEYVDALHKTVLLGERAPVSEDLVRKPLNHARLQSLITMGDSLKARNELEAAKTQYERALQLVAEIRDDLSPIKVKELEASLHSTVAEVQEYIRETAFAADIGQGDQFFSEKQWSQAIASYESALQMAYRANGELDPRAKKLEVNRDIARLNAMYEKGNAELKAGHWDGAIQQLELSEKLRSRIVATGTDLAIGKEIIKRKILVARISQEKAAAARYLRKKEYAKANKALAAIVSMVDLSGMAADREFALAKNTAANRITENKFLLEVEEQKRYLEKNYQEIFIQHFPSSARFDFSNPEILLVQQDDSFLYFSMQCKATDRRLQSTFNLNYKFHRETGRWSSH